MTRAPDIDLDVHLPAIGAGDPDGFAAWVAGAERPLRLALRSFAAVVDVEAVLQEALLRVWQVAARVEPDGRPNALLRFAHRVARNLAISMLRARREVPAENEVANEVAIGGASLPDPLLRRLLAACRDKLPAKPGQALDARLGGGVDPDALLARRLGMTLNTFLQNFTRARRLLADCLKKHGVEVVG